MSAQNALASHLPDFCLRSCARLPRKPKIKFLHRLNRRPRHAFGTIELNGGHNV
jgi:hypothetical protein